MAEVASAYVSLLPSFRGGAAAIAKELGGPVSKAGEDGGKQYGEGMRTGISGMASRIFAPLAAAAAGISVGTFLKDAITQASDLSEAGTALKEVFGTATSSVLKFASQGATALGQNQLAVQNAAQTFGVYGKAAGLAEDANAEFSTALVGLSTDLASFYNTSPEQAVEALAAGLRGESEPLRQYGILLDDATLKARAMSMGIFEGTGSLTQQQRVLAAQAEILAQSSVAQGDFARTSDGLANQQRILSAQFTDLQGQIGQRLLPVVTTVVSYLNANFIPATQRVGSAIGTVIGFVDRNRTAFTALAVVIGAITAATLAHTAVLTVQAAGGLAAYIAQLGIVRTATAVWAAVQWVLNAALSANPIGIVVIAIAALVAAIVYAWNNSETFRTIVTAAWEGIKAAVEAVVNWFTTTIPQVWNNITTWTSNAWDGIVSFFRQIPNRILQFFLNWTLPGLLIQHWDSIKQGAVNGFNAVVDFVRGIPQRIVDGLGALGQLLYSAGRDLLQGLINGITDKVSGAITAVKDAVSGVIDGAKDLLGINSPSRVFMEIGAYTSEGFALGIESRQRLASDAMSNLVAPPAVPRMNANVSGVAGAVNGVGAADGRALVQQTIYPTPGMSETQVGEMAGRRAASALIGVPL